MRILTYNINGIRAAERKGLGDFLRDQAAEVVCFQEIKAQADQMDLLLYTSLGYLTYWFPARKKGYSGVGILSKTEPRHVEYGCGISEFDKEGRLIRADFNDLSVLSVYFPSGSSGDERQAVKMKWLEVFLPYVDNLRKTHPNLVISGDYNICHQEIDIHDPKRNKNHTGFLPEEREWMTTFLESGFIDSFRHLHPNEPDRYTWWSQIHGARQSNKGWRIDYHMVSQTLESRLVEAEILESAMHSDHCPVRLSLSNDLL